MQQPNLPKIQPNLQNQVLIHPDHAAGNLKIPSNNPGSVKPKISSGLVIISIISLSAILLLGFVALPRTRSVMYAAGTAETLGNLSSRTNNVNDALDLLYQSLTSSSAGDDTSLSEANSGVLAANSSASTNFLSGNSLLLFQKVKGVLEKTGKVKGFSIPKDDPNKVIREQRKLAENVSDKASLAQELIDSDLVKLQKSSFLSGINSLKTDVENLSSKTDLYLAESTKTAKYYVSISDAAIELYNISNQINSFEDIDNSISDLTKVRNVFANYDKKALPAEIDDLNQDVVSVFDLLIGFFQKIKSESSSNLLNSLTDFVGQTNNLAVQTSIHELNFWQNNKILSSYKELTSSYDTAIKKAAQVKSDNNYFLLPLFGIK